MGLKREKFDNPHWQGTRRYYRSQSPRAAGRSREEGGEDQKGEGPEAAYVYAIREGDDTCGRLCLFSPQFLPEDVWRVFPHALDTVRLAD